MCATGAVRCEPVDLCDECVQCMATGAPADNPALPPEEVQAGAGGVLD
jgi:hypothetical protein